MITKYYIPIIWALLLLALIFPYKERWTKTPRPIVSLAQSTWEFVPTKLGDASGRLLKGPRYYLEFVNDSIFLVQLEATKVYGLYRYQAGNQSITFGNIQHINQQCCNSQFSLSLIDELRSIQSCQLSNGNLKLYGKTDLTFKAKYI
ncbi:hypothetical protein [Cyclobacterium plantarum]|uniref:hypothetical protein n=1 Tax=Cyclobacterium plantarum TaxID=2716263 RepID=UPI003F6EF83C